MSSFEYRLWIAIAIGVVVWCTVSVELQYQAVKPYYPNMSRWEYFLLSEKLRITPDE